MINCQPIVQEYFNCVTAPKVSSCPTPSTSMTSPSTSLALIPYHSRDVIPVYKIQWSNPSEISCSRFTPSIEYQDVPSLTAGPSSFLDSQFNLKCINCQVEKLVTIYNNYAFHCNHLYVLFGALLVYVFTMLIMLLV